METFFLKPGPSFGLVFSPSSLGKPSLIFSFQQQERRHQLEQLRTWLSGSPSPAATVYSPGHYTPWKSVVCADCGQSPELRAREVLPKQEGWALSNKERKDYSKQRKEHGRSKGIDEKRHGLRELPAGQAWTH